MTQYSYKARTNLILKAGKGCTRKTNYFPHENRQKISQQNINTLSQAIYNKNNIAQPSVVYPRNTRLA